MTDVELLPLPEPVVVAEELEFGAIYAYERRHMEAYARANLEPLLAERDALLEACRLAARYLNPDQFPDAVKKIDAAIDQARGKAGQEVGE